MSLFATKPLDRIMAEAEGGERQPDRARHRRHHAPLRGNYGEPANYVIFAFLLLCILTITEVFALRRTRPEMERLNQV